MAADKTKVVFNALSGNFDLVQDVTTLVDGPVSATDNAIARFDGTTGTLLQSSGVTVDDSANIATSGQITVGSDAVSSLQVVTKQQLDAAIQGVVVKQGVVAASTADLTLSGEQTVDGIALVAGNRVLVKNQSTQTENGIYDVAVGAWARSADANTGPELEHALVVVAQGTQANSGWYQISDNITIGVTNIVFNQFFGAGTYTADGQGIELTGSTFSLELDGTTLSKSASGVKVADLGIADAQVSATAAIARSKLANGTANRVVVNSGAGVLSDAAAITANRALISDTNGIPTHSAVSNVELGYVQGVTSAIQTQLDSKISGFETVAVSSDIAVTSNRVSLVDTSAARSLTLPASSANIQVHIKDASGLAETNNITITPASGTIDGQATLVINSDYGSAHLICNGTNWFIL